MNDKNIGLEYSFQYDFNDLSNLHLWNIILNWLVVHVADLIGWNLE